MKKFLTSLPVRLLAGVLIGIAVGLVANEQSMVVLVSLKYVINQLIMFCVPLIIIGFIAPSITKLGSNASRMLGVALIIAYSSTVLATGFSATAGYAIIPNITIPSEAAALNELPEAAFKLDIPQILPVMSALVFAIMIGLGAAFTKAKTITAILDEFQKIILLVVKKVVIPILPIFIALTFAGLAYEGMLTKQLPVFLLVIVIVVIGHFIWLAVLYSIGGAYSKKNPLEVIKNYGPAYLTAVGTMSSAATLAIALRCAKKSKPLREDMVDFGIPLFANIHLCGSALTEVFFVMTVSQILYGSIPSVGTMILFILLLGIFAIGAPGVPGGTVMASLGLITGILGFDSTGTALMLAIFALQDSFGTACNVTGDGALTMILTGYADKHNLKKEEIDSLDGDIVDI